MPNHKKISVYTAWSNYGYPQTSIKAFLDVIHSATDQDHLIYYAPEEFNFASNPGDNGLTPALILRVFESAKRKNTRITVITGRHPSSIKPEMEGIDTICLLGTRNLAEIYSWSDYFFFANGRYFLEAGGNSIIQYHNGKSPSVEIKEKNPLMLFCTLNMNPHPHRAMLIDRLAELDLIKHNVVTWLKPGREGYEFKHWTECLLDDPYLSYGDDGHVIQYHTKMPDYHNTLFDIVAESSPDVLFWTEKTVRPIANFKPFVVLGAQHANKKLLDLGFVLFEEIFDYEFDSMESYEDRLRSLTSQVKELSINRGPADFVNIRNLVSEKITHNFKRLVSIMHEPSIPADGILSKLGLYNHVIDSNKEILHNDYFRDIIEENTDGTAT